MNHMELQLFKTDKNGTKYFYDWKCPRCAGFGQADKWRYTGLVCFECNGTGKRSRAKIVKEYTDEYAAKLEERRIARQKKYEEEHAEEIAAKKAEQDRREAEWQRKEEIRIFKASGCGENGIGYVLTGNTYPVKEQIKALGGKWIYGAWVCPEEVKGDGITARKIDLNTCRNEFGIVSQYDVNDLIYDTQNL